MKETYSKKCIKCKKEIEFKAKSEDIEKWKKGAYIQDVMPYLKVDERELLISGICGPCFDKMFS